MRTMDLRSHSGNSPSARGVLRTKAGREEDNRHLTDENPKLKWLSLLAMYWNCKE
jgi:hypothetical protein